jgi:hypothetical protein
MVGGVEDEFAAAQELLECMGSNVVYCGAVGTGQVMLPHNNRTRYKTSFFSLTNACPSLLGSCWGFRAWILGYIVISWFFIIALRSVQISIQ